MRRILEIDGVEIPVWLAAPSRTHVLHMDEREIPCVLEETAGRGAYTLVLGGTRIPMRIAVGEGATFIHVDGRAYEIGRIDPADFIGTAIDVDECCPFAHGDAHRDAGAAQHERVGTPPSRFFKNARNFALIHMQHMGPGWCGQPDRDFHPVDFQNAAHQFLQLPIRR